jgi:hypothetical protein
MQRQEKAIQGEPNVPLLDKLTKIKQTNGGFADVVNLRQRQLITLRSSFF